MLPKFTGIILYGDGQRVQRFANPSREITKESDSGTTDSCGQMTCTVIEVYQKAASLVDSKQCF
jgi:hypothetical protein